MPTRRPTASSARATAACAALVVTTALFVALACGPGGFDGLTGGTKDAGADATLPPVADPALAAPRPIAPLSFGHVATSRPVLRWELEDPLTGAIVEMCKTRACDAVAKTWETDGRTFTVPEDLEAGVWFWRLRGRAPGKNGVKTSPVWQLLVRGPNANGASTSPAGAIVDANGDGHADLLVAVRVGLDTEGNPIDDLAVYFGGADGLPSSPSQVLQVGSEIATIAAGTDFNGDGFTDLVLGLTGIQIDVDGGVIKSDAEAPIFLAVYHGSEKGYQEAQELPGLARAFALGHGMHEAGDVNGDGYGDVVVTSSTDAVVLLGAKDGLTGPLVPLNGVFFGPLTITTPNRLAFGALDMNNDGLMDVAVGSLRANAPATMLLGDRGGVAAQAVALDPQGGVSFGTGALAAAALDLNGDGIADIAFSATESKPPPGSPNPFNDVCVLGGPAPSPKALGCVVGNPGFGASMIGVDIDGNKSDELIVRTSRGVLALHLSETGVFTDLPSEVNANTGFGDAAVLTTMMPSRPGPATWAVWASGLRIFVMQDAKSKKILDATGRPFTGLIR